MAVDVHDVPGAKRYEAREKGESRIAGIAEYEGRGVGAALVRTDLDEARAGRTGLTLFRQHTVGSPP